MAGMLLMVLGLGGFAVLAYTFAFNGHFHHKDPVYVVLRGFFALTLFFVVAGGMLLRHNNAEGAAAQRLVRGNKLQFSTYKKSGLFAAKSDKLYTLIFYSMLLIVVLCQLALYLQLKSTFKGLSLPEDDTQLKEQSK